MMSRLVGLVVFALIVPFDKVAPGHIIVCLALMELAGVLGQIVSKDKP